VKAGKKAWDRKYSNTKKYNKKLKIKNRGNPCFYLKKLKSKLVEREGSEP
jgi:hypothetical protein